MSTRFAALRLNQPFSTLLIIALTVSTGCAKIEEEYSHTILSKDAFQESDPRFPIVYKSSHTVGGKEFEDKDRIGAAINPIRWWPLANRQAVVWDASAQLVEVHLTESYMTESDVWGIGWTFVYRSNEKDGTLFVSLTEKGIGRVELDESTREGFIPIESHWKWAKSSFSGRNSTWHLRSIEPGAVAWIGTITESRITGGFKQQSRISGRWLIDGISGESILGAEEARLLKVADLPASTPWAP